MKLVHMECTAKSVVQMNRDSGSSEYSLVAQFTLLVLSHSLMRGSRGKRGQGVHSSPPGKSQGYRVP